VRRFGISLVALGLLAGCGPRWPEENLEAFTRACLANARKQKPDAPEQALVDYCRCTADGLQRRYTIEQFEAIEQRSMREKKPAMELVEVVEECTGRSR
jgi:hypothetical protein